MADPVLNGTTLPCPSEYEETGEYRHSEQVMANGSIVRDIVNSANKRAFRLKWSKLTAQNKADLRTAWNATFISSTGVAYNDLNGLGYTVKTDSEISKLVFTRLKSGTELYECEMRLREV
jgi:hypothetical protein